MAATDISPIPVSQPLQLTITNPQGQQFWNGAGNTPSFKDVLDTINPLQHLPVISTLYRNFTGDTISPAANLAGGALYGGPVGFIASIANEVVQSATGKDIGSNLLAWAEGNNPITPADPNAAPEPPLGVNQKLAYNAYLHTQDLLS